MTLACAAGIFCTGAAGAQPLKMHVKSRLLDFEYSWPSEVGAVPALVRHFTGDMREERKTMLADAREASGAKDSLMPFAQYSFYRDVATAGQSGRFLSLKIKTYEFTGGAHGNTYSEAFLWDRKRRRTVPFAGMLVDKDAIGRLLRSPFCHKLHDERTRRNGQEMSGVFDDCPKLSDLKILPGDAEHHGKFDVIRLVADQGVAGSNAEGEYDIPVPVTAKLAAAVKPEYRSSFEAQRQ
ncbi:MAG TPA: DUF4163 domain-containing protein [Sphingomicrobium sp.]|nr:DUF4163 domain-containing protein [Sphingomicrobium sp.]